MRIRPELVYVERGGSRMPVPLAVQASARLDASAPPVCPGGVDATAIVWHDGQDRSGVMCRLDGTDRWLLIGNGPGAPMKHATYDEALARMSRLADGHEKAWLGDAKGRITHAVPAAVDESAGS